MFYRLSFTKFSVKNHIHIPKLFLTFVMNGKMRSHYFGLHLSLWYFTTKTKEWLEDFSLTHWGRVTHICVGKLTIFGSDNGLSPERRQANIWTNAGILLIGPLVTNFSEILIEIQTFSLKKIRSKMSSVKWCSFRLGFNEFRVVQIQKSHC